MKCSTDSNGKLPRSDVLSRRPPASFPDVTVDQPFSLWRDPAWLAEPDDTTLGEQD